jgi:hypothetical protein
MQIQGFNSIQTGTIDLYLWYTTTGTPASTSAAVTIIGLFNGASLTIATNTLTHTALATQTNYAFDIQRSYIEKNNR